MSPKIKHEVRLKIFNVAMPPLNLGKYLHIC